MTTPETPDWLQKHRSKQTPPDKPKRGNPKWEPGMPSPNPAGRPKGVVDKRARLMHALASKADDVLHVVIDAALEGDIQAAGLVLARIVPVLKAQAERVTFEFDAKGSLVEQVQAVLQAVADGHVPPDVAHQIIGTIGSLSGIKMVEQLEERLNRLEGKA